MSFQSLSACDSTSLLILLDQDYLSIIIKLYTQKVVRYMATANIGFEEKLWGMSDKFRGSAIE